MEEHDNETRELEQTMERALAVAIAHGSSMVESWAKLVAKQRNRKGQSTDTDKPAPPNQAADDLGHTAAKLEQRARHDLAKGRPDATFWLTASPDELVEKFRAEAAEKAPLRDLDPRRLGDRSYDRQWAQNTRGTAVVGVLDLAHRYADEAVVAANVRDNLCEQIRDLGLDPDELMRMDPAEAGRRYEQTVGAARYGSDNPFSFGSDNSALPSMTHDGSDSVDRDGAQVAALLSQAQAADDRAATAEHNADLAAERAEVLDQSAPPPPPVVAAGPQSYTPPPPQMSRAERVGTASPTAPGRAAATAARDHPTNPRAAVASAPRSQARAKTGGGKSADRQRTRGM
ncbi:hypothetical protein RD149_21825 [Gordonia westfalica]|uniref:DUF222 domain-containing protein n=1 Tax=Gordonia westfalica TaxID=158898 RepID=A0ABU2GY49_9ACTN|nr:hypothetical protein [Gordonia westfalica]MDS1116387.1 hypothetical protein [Gordonia westfalica]